MTTPIYDSLLRELAMAPPAGAPGATEHPGTPAEHTARTATATPGPAPR
ncbi:hypothetical protein [Actinophytocola sp. KF-1]